MAAASPIPCLAARFGEWREEIVCRCADLRAVDTPAARSELAGLREVLRLTAAPCDRLGAMAAAVTAPAPVEPLVPRRPADFSDARNHPLGSSAMGTARNP